MLAPWGMTRTNPRVLLIGATLVMAAACAVAAMSARLDLLISVRLVQGLAGGILLVVGQAIVFIAWPRSRQPLLQAVFAMGAVVAPATTVPALQGWLLDIRSWTWIFFGVVPLGLAAAGLLLLDDTRIDRPGPRRPFDGPGLALIAVAFCCLTFVLAQGSRWDWLVVPHVRWATAIGGAALMAFLAWQLRAGDRGLCDFTVFGSTDFSFAFIVSFVAGAALFGSAYLIQAFAVSVLGFTPTAAGLLLLPSGAVFCATLLLAAVLMQARRVPPVATVPLGILTIMAAMWMLSGSAGDSGADDMMAAVLLRGFALGCLFLSITLIAYGQLDDARVAAGIALFNTGRQVGGLIGVAGLQTMIDHDVQASMAVLGAHLTSGAPAVAERLSAVAAMLAARGMEATNAARAATALLARAVAGQSSVIAFDTAFNAVALLFVVAAPAIVAVKIALARYARSRAAKEVLVLPSR